MKNTNREVVIVEGVRSPIGKHGGCYNNLSAEDLGVLAVKEVLQRSKFDLSKHKIDQVVAGMIYVESQCQNIYLPRNVATRVAKCFNDTENLNTAPGKTSLRICGTGFQTMADGYDLIMNDDTHRMNTVLTFTCESMSQTNKVQQGRRIKGEVWEFEKAESNDFLLESFNHKLFNTMMPKTAEKYGAMLGISRKDCDELAYNSHIRSKHAQLNQWNRLSTTNGHHFLKGVFSLDTTDQQGNPIYQWRDEGTRHDISMEELVSLRPMLMKDGLVTPGTASQISDGAASVLLMDRETAEKNNISYIAKLSAYQFATVDPEIMGQGPVPAIRQLLEKCNLKQSNIDLFEVNEAFAAQYLGVEKELNLPREITNVNGGAIAQGHCIAATGMRLVVDLIYELKRRNQNRGIASACIGGGQGGAVLVEIV